MHSDCGEEDKFTVGLPLIMLSAHGKGKNIHFNVVRDVMAVHRRPLGGLGDRELEKRLMQVNLRSIRVKNCMK